MTKLASAGKQGASHEIGSSVSIVATAFCLVFIGYLFWIDLKSNRQHSHALWIPIAWMFLAGSRWASSWLNMAPSFESANDYSEGSPIDRAVFFSLIAMGVVVLSRRKVDWGRLTLANVIIVIYFLYCLMSAAWSDDPFVLMKRWVKELGNPVMALVILTERHPYQALAAVLRRLTFLLIPLSVLFIRYYPGLGRSYHADGSPMYTGVGHQKNDLGAMCLIAGIYIFWELFQGDGRSSPAFMRQHKLLAAAFIATVLWLLRMSDSQTSIACLLTSVSLLALSRAPFVAKNPARIVSVLIGGVGAIFLIEETLHVKEFVLDLMGRDPSLTNRTEVWKTVIQFEVDPIIGAGFMSFWSGARMDNIWSLLGAGINQAHNGYIEQYLNLGYVGVAFIIAILVSGLVDIHRHLSVSPASGMLRLCFWVTAVLVNYTEASFYGINTIWMLTLLSCLRAPQQQHPVPGRQAYRNFRAIAAAKTS